MIYAGTFRQIAAQINSIDPATGEMKVTDLATKKPLIVRVTPDSTMKKLPEAMAQALARRYQGGRGGAPSDAGRGRGVSSEGRGGEVGQMLDRLPSIQLADLKPKDADHDFHDAGHGSREGNGGHVVGRSGACPDRGADGDPRHHERLEPRRGRGRPIEPSLTGGPFFHSVTC